jgi:hypothetical protein
VGAKPQRLPHQNFPRELLPKIGKPVTKFQDQKKPFLHACMPVRCCHKRRLAQSATLRSHKRMAIKGIGTGRHKNSVKPPFVLINAWQSKSGTTGRHKNSVQVKLTPSLSHKRKAIKKKWNSRVEQKLSTQLRYRSSSSAAAAAATCLRESSRF